MERKLTIKKVNIICGISTIIIMTGLFLVFFVWQKYAEFRNSERILKDSQESVVSEVLSERLATAVASLDSILSSPQISARDENVTRELMRNSWSGGATALIDNATKEMSFHEISFLGRLDEKNRISLASQIPAVKIKGQTASGQATVHISGDGTARVRWRAESIAGGRMTIVALKDMRGIDTATLGNINRMKIDMIIEAAFIVSLALAVCLVAIRFAYSVAKSIDREVSLLTEFCEKGIENESVLSSASFKFREFDLVGKSLAAMAGQIRALLLELKNAALKSTITQQMQYGIYSKLSHEIVSKLNDLLGSAQMLRTKFGAETPENASKIQDVENIIDSGMVISNILTDISYMPALDTSDFKPSLSLVKLGEIKESISSQIANLARQRDKKIEWKTGDTEEKSLFADKNFLRQILLNLVEIGIYRDSCSGIEIEFALSETEEDRQEIRLQMKIVLKSMGLLQSHLDEMKRFPFVSAEFAGMALRIAICKRLAELLDGTFDIAVVGSDLFATFSAPFLIGKTHVAGTRSPFALSIPNLVALVVDDDHGSREVMATMLSALGVKTVKAADGLAALEALEKNPSINIVFLDCQMPVMNGFAFTREIRKRENESDASKRLKIIAASGYSTPSDIQRCIETGMDDFISKPFIIGELKLILMKHCS